MKLVKSFKYDFTGMPCKQCGVLLSEKNHSNRSKLNKEQRKKRRPWRICKFCLTEQKARTRNRERDRAYNRAYKVKNWEKTLLSGCKKRAKEKKLKFEIDLDDIKKLTKKQNKRCYWFNVKLDFIDKKKYLFKPSIDRIDNKKGYTKKNIVLVSYFANIARGETNFRTWERSAKLIIKSLKRNYEKNSQKL